MEREIENLLIQSAAILETIIEIIDEQKEPSDFMMSFPVVSKIWDLQLFYNQNNTPKPDEVVGNTNEKPN